MKHVLLYGPALVLLVWALLEAFVNTRHFDEAMRVILAVSIVLQVCVLTRQYTLFERDRRRRNNLS